jgi:glycosyltransferase involved in cell wall biosynthesis
MNPPFKTSLVISTFNRPQMLAKALAGVRLQTRQPDEILISDDGSDESTRHLVNEFTAESPAPVKHIWQAHRPPYPSRKRLLGPGTALFRARGIRAGI